MSLLGAFTKTAASVPLFNNTKRLARLAYRRRYYLAFVRAAFGRIPIVDMLRSHFAFALPTADRPSYVTVELTNYCNLRCPYCTNPTTARSRGMMTVETARELAAQIRALSIPRVRLVGNGEPTLNPNFTTIVREFARATRFVQLVTNGQRLSDEIIDAIVTAPVHLVEISADADTKDEYEAARIGGSFDRLLDNLTRLKARRDELRSPTLVNIRAMISPSRKLREREIVRFWSSYGDTVMPQYIVNITGEKTAYEFASLHAAEGTIPRCAVTLKAMVVLYDGTVPLCGLSMTRTPDELGLVVGAVPRSTLSEIWRAPIMNQYRKGHRTRNGAMTPICRGCVGG